MCRKMLLLVTVYLSQQAAMPAVYDKHVVLSKEMNCKQDIMMPST